MAANNETGVVQPIDEIANELTDHAAYFHVDAAQSFGKQIAPLRSGRIDLISVSGHKVFAPKGIGALIMRRRGALRVPLEPLMYGGGQEDGLRPGTLPVALIAGLGAATSLALSEHQTRATHNAAIRRDVVAALAPLNIHLNGDETRTLPHTINFSVPGVDAGSAIVALRGLVAISTGSTCAAHSHDGSHVLAAAGLPTKQIAGALRISWSHLGRVS